MGDRATLEKIYAIMRRLLLIKMDGLNPIPRKGTTRHECYRALYEIQELLETRRYFGKHLPQTNADRIRSMTDEELSIALCRGGCPPTAWDEYGVLDCPKPNEEVCEEVCGSCWLNWLKQEVQCTSE